MTAPALEPTLLIYLHGFRSSPRSFKALRLHDWLRRHRPALAWWCPQLPPSPQQAIDEIEAGLQARAGARPALIGSSLGGFYASCIAERTGCPAVLINPAVDPARDLASHVGEQTAYHDSSQRFTFEPGYVDELRRLAPAGPSAPERYLAVIAKCDEVLDWREMAARYAGCHMRLIEGSDHGLSDFDQHLPAILQFLHLDR